MFQTKMYVQELLNYLHTVTIKDTLLAAQMFDTWVRPEYKEILPPELHPYYRNITGDYILRDYSALEIAYGIDKATMSPEEYISEKARIAQIAESYGLKTTTVVNGVPRSNESIYSKFNDLVVLNSMDDQTVLPLTKSILTDLNHIKTVASYKIPNINYYNLCNKYPNSSAVIKAILYPIPDILTPTGTIEKPAINVAIDAPNMTLLHSDLSLLEVNEQNVLYETMVETLNYIKVRWGVSEFVFEDMYAVAHQAIMWNMLFLALNIQRIKNIKTYSAHSYHIWEYLKSHGFGDYKTILTRQQALFLYKNIRYLLKHKGTEKVLELLSYVLLEPWNIRPHSKSIVQQPEDVFEKQPKYIESTKIPTNVLTERVGETMYNRLEEIRAVSNSPYPHHRKNLSYQEILIELEKVAGTDVSIPTSSTTFSEYELLKTLFEKERDSQLEYVDEPLFERSTTAQNKAFSITPHAMLKTKLLELTSPLNSDIFAACYARFVTQQILYLASTKSLRFAVHFSPDVSETIITLNAYEAIALLIYAVNREYGYAIENPPTNAYITTAYKRSFPKLPESTYTCGIPVSIKPYLRKNSQAVAIDVRKNNLLQGVYTPRTKNKWVHTQDHNKYLQYDPSTGLWEFIVDGSVVVYSNKIIYNLSNIFSNVVPWEPPKYWYRTDGTRIVLMVTEILNPDIPSMRNIDTEMDAHPADYASVEDFSKTIHKQASNYISIFVEANNVASHVFSDIIAELHKDRLVKEYVGFNLLNGKSYTEFFNSEIALKNLITNLDSSDNVKEAYAMLASSILNSIYPITDYLKQENEYLLKKIYKKLKELFVSMCSYNVAFLEPTTENVITNTTSITAIQPTSTVIKVSYKESLLSIDAKVSLRGTVHLNDMNSMQVSENVNVQVKQS